MGTGALISVWKDPAQTETEALPWGVPAWKERDSASPIKFLTSPVLAPVIYSDVTPVSGRPWVSVHQENQPYVKAFHISQGPREPHVCDGEVLKHP